MAIHDPLTSSSAQRKDSWDPLATLTFALQSNRGVFALLLGSGVSRGAGILTAHDILLDLLRQLAGSRKDDCTEDPIAWYQGKFGEAPNYSTLLERIGPSAPEQRAILRRYFEPHIDEDARDARVPSKAHQAIAGLVRRGYVRVIVTTNFDRLIERALTAEGVPHVVVSTPEQAEGCDAITHLPCLVLKVHGDYQDQRILNTTEELSSLEPSVNRLLDQIFMEYGLVVCGWSATYDHALRAALERSPSRRYPAFWTTIGELSPDADALIARRGARTIEIRDADSFFHEIAERLEVMDKFGREDPITGAVVVGRTKKYLSEPRYLIELEELVASETRRAVDSLSKLGLRGSSSVPSEELALRCEASVARLCAVVACGAYFGGAEHVRLWINVLEALRELEPREADGLSTDSLARYAGVLVFFAAGVSAYAARAHKTYCSLLASGKRPDQEAAEGFALRWNSTCIDHRIFQTDLLAGSAKAKTPLSNSLFRALGSAFLGTNIEGERLETAFAEWEVLVGLVFAKARAKKNEDSFFPLGRFAWNLRSLSAIEREATELGAAWPPYNERLFGADLGAVLTRISRVREEISRRPWSP